jgi:hypothetical protein
MALALRGTPTHGGGSGTAVSTSLPGGVTAGDLILFGVWSKTLNATFTTPTGFAHITGSPFGAGGEGECAVFSKTATGGDAAPSSTISASNTYRWSVVVLSGSSPTLQDVDFTETTNYSSNPTMPTSAAGGNTVWSLIFLWTATNGGETPTWPTGWTEDHQEHGGAFTNRHFLARNTSPGTGSIGGSTITMATERGQEKVVQMLVKEGGGASTKAYPFRRRPWRVSSRWI